MVSTGAQSKRRRQIVIAGGGFAALESLLALRALLGAQVDITLVARSRWLPDRPAASAEALGSEPSRVYDLLAIAEEQDARFREDRLEAVASEQHRVRLASFAVLSYDTLVLALGARSRVAIPGALTFRDQRDLPQMRRMIDDLRDGVPRRLVFALPDGCSSPLLLYELAVSAARENALRAVGVSVTIVTAEHAPLEMFGPDASRAAGRMLSDAGVQLVTGAAPIAVRRDGSLLVRTGAAIPADRVVAAPALRGRRLAGVPHGAHGFVPVERDGRVVGLEDVYAAGEMTTFPIRHPGIAAQQADVIANAIAASPSIALRLGREASSRRPARRLRQPARLLARSRALHLQAALDPIGRPLASGGERSSTQAYAGAEGRYLADCLAARMPLRRGRLAPLT